MKILYVVRTMNIGGLENFLRYIINENYKKYQCECLICDTGISDYEEELADKIPIHKINAPIGIKIKFANNLNAFFGKNNKYDIVHVHMAFSNGIVGITARFNGIKHIIYHSHGMDMKNNITFSAKLYQRVMRRIMISTGSSFMACSKEAGNYLFGKKVFEERGIILKNGIDVKHYVCDTDVRNKIRSTYGFTINDCVVGHVGTLNWNKNQILIIRAAARLIREGYYVKVLLVGDGIIREELKQEAEKTGISKDVVFAGKRKDVSPFLSAMDVFMFPSISEGFGISMIEAQAAGLPCVVSDSIQSEAKILKNQIVTVNLEEPVVIWCEAMKSAMCMEKIQNTYEILNNSGYDICHTINQLNEVYDKWKDE